MAKTSEYAVENHWWSEGWRLVRARIPQIFTWPRQRILLVVVGLSASLALVGGLLLLSVIDEEDTFAEWALVALLILGAIQVSFSVCVLVWGHRDRQPEFRAGRVSPGLEGVFNLKHPLPPMSEQMRAEARVHVDRLRHSLPASVVGLGTFQLLPPLILILIAVSGWWGANAWILLVLVLTNGWQPVFFLKMLGSTTAQLRRLDEAEIVEPPTYLGPTGWGIEAPRNPPESGGASG